MTASTTSRIAVDALARDRTGPDLTIPQYSKQKILGVWAAATAPMAVLAWVVASTRRFRSTWMGLITHTAPSFVIFGVVLSLVV